MKKVTAILCAFAMFFTFAVNAGATELDFMDKEYKSYDATVEFSLQLNKSFDFVKVIADYLTGNNDIIDYQRFAESLMNATYTADIQAETGADYKSAKMAMAISANLPIELSEDLSIAVGTKVRLWIDYDFSGENNLKYDIIVTNPLNGKYYYIDYLELIKGMSGDEEAEELIADMMRSIDAKSGVSEIKELVKNLLTGNAKISSSGNTRTIELSGDAVGNYLSELITGIIKSDYMNNLLESVQGAEGDAEPYEMADEDIREITDVIKSLKIFADDAVSIKITLDDDGFIKESDEKVHIAFNIAELCESFGVSSEDIEPLTKENSDVDFTLITKVVFRRVKDVTVEMPALTEENSVDLMEALGPMLGIYDDGDNDYDYEKWEEYYYRTSESIRNHGINAKAIDLSNSEFYVDIEYLLFYTYGCDDLYGSMDFDENGNVTIEYESKAVEKTVVTAKVGEKAYSVNGVPYEAKYPFILNSYETVDYDWEAGEYVDKTVSSVYVGIDVLNTLFGSKVVGYAVSFDTDGAEPLVWVDLERPNPGYDPNYGEIEGTVEIY